MNELAIGCGFFEVTLLTGLDRLGRAGAVAERLRRGDQDIQPLTFAATVWTCLTSTEPTTFLTS